jgi:hypothetical protein
MRNEVLLTLVVLAIVVAVSIPRRSTAQNAVPLLMNYQGELRSPTTGETVPDGDYDMVLRIHDAESGGSLLWEGTYTAANSNAVQVANGIFSVILGSGSGNALDASFFEGPDRWLEIEVAGEMLSPRQRITSAAFSIVSENSRLLNGREVSDFIIQAQGLRLETNEISPNVIGGYILNRVTDGVIGATVSGGGESGLENRVSDSFGTVGGGRSNQAGDDAGTANDKPGATVGGGAWNIASGRGATVGGGLGNQAAADFATIAGGGRSDPADPLTGNRVTDDYGTVGGGARNQAGDNAGATDDADHATVGGGYKNTAGDEFTTIGGGGANTAEGYAATIAGGWNSTAQGYCATVGGGLWNEAANELATVSGGDSNSATAEYATVGGGCMNQAIAKYATVSGGGSMDGLVYTANRVTDEYGTVAGGGNNQAGDNAGTKSDANFATVGGGHTNVAGAFSATVAGGAVNTANAAWAAIGGGNWNKVTDENGTIAGGNNNQAGDDAGTTQDASYATVGGGLGNKALAKFATIAGGGRSDVQDPNTGNRVTDEYGTVGGGGNNQAGDDVAATQDAGYATVSGGGWNTASSKAATVGGGAGNTASGVWATVPGGCSNTAEGIYSFAAGWNAKANHAGTFVWGDYQPTDIASTRMNEVTFRCKGGVRFLSASGGNNQMVSWVPGDSLWSFSSDRNLKEDFVEVDARQALEKVIALPIAEWNFKGYSQRHVGPVAQDFHALFPLGGSDTMIDSGDLQGVSLAAIQGLHKIIQEKEDRISTLEQRNEKLEARLAVLEALVQTLLEERKGGEK